MTSELAKVEEAREQLFDILTKTNKTRPEQSDVVALRTFLHDNPQLWQLTGNLGERVANRLVESLNGAPALLSESLKAGYEQLQKDLSVEGASALEKVLIQQIALSWLRLLIVEHRHAAATEGSYSIRVGEHWEKRLDAAQRRFLRASESLARVRKMNLPPIQVNIAQQQVNQVNT